MRTETLTVPVGDIDLACTVVGEGTPLVVVHGAIGLGSTYLRALDTWANDVRLVHYDQRGSGRTPLGDVSKATMSGGVDDLEGLLQSLGLDRVQLLGHSAGAYLAALYAAAHPETTSAASRQRSSATSSTRSSRSSATVRLSTGFPSASPTSPPPTSVSCPSA